MDLLFVVRGLAAPVICVLLLALSVPYTLSKGVTPLLGESEGEEEEEPGGEGGRTYFISPPPTSAAATEVLRGQGEGLTMVLSCFDPELSRWRGAWLTLLLGDSLLQPGIGFYKNKVVPSNRWKPTNQRRLAGSREHV